MAKGIGLIGNFKGKVGNMVGYKLTASNTGNTQGVRVYQPIVKNPKTSAQAEQRAKLAPINATYRALKMVIDRGNEGLPYGNKSRLAWLKQAFKAEDMPWFEKGAAVTAPVACVLSKGSLTGVIFRPNVDGIEIQCSHVTDETPLTTIGAVSTALLGGYPQLKNGDQLTFVSVSVDGDAIATEIASIVLDEASSVATEMFVADSNKILVNANVTEGGVAVIVSREGTNGEHLRSTTSLVLPDSVLAAAPYDSDSKAAAIKSYMSSAAVNADWAEESIQ